MLVCILLDGQTGCINCHRDVAAGADASLDVAPAVTVVHGEIHV